MTAQQMISKKNETISKLEDIMEEREFFFLNQFNRKIRFMQADDFDEKVIEVDLTNKKVNYFSFISEEKLPRDEDYDYLVAKVRKLLVF